MTTVHTPFTALKNEAVFHVRRLTKIYGEESAAVHALGGVDLDLYPGELVVLLGASGSGKSTLLNILGGLDSPTTGELVFRGRALAEADEVFTADRLAAQQASVMRRLEALERPARVIAFPKFSRPVATPQRHVQRWVASAAAAGLIIGLAAGQFVDIRDAFGRRESGSIAQTRPTQPRQMSTSPAVATISTSSVSDEDIFFGNMVRTAQYSTLQTMDDITPRARDSEQVR